MKNYERPMANEIKIDLCNIILTSEVEAAPNLGDIVGGAAEWMGSYWN